MQHLDPAIASHYKFGVQTKKCLNSGMLLLLGLQSALPRLLLDQGQTVICKPTRDFFHASYHASTAF